MSEIEYSDDLLLESENLANVDWDALDTGGKLSPANTPHLCLIKKVGGYLHNFEGYTGPRAKIQLQVIDGPDKGKTQFDDVNMPHPQENQWGQQRRVLIGSRMGLIQKGSKDISKINWKTLEGREVLITVEPSKKDPKYINVTFDGWQDPAAAPAATGAAPAGAAASANAYDDI